MKKQTLRDYLAVHTWVGILCGLVLFIAFYAGAFSMLEAEITRWTKPPPPASSALSDDGDALVTAFFAAHPQAKGRVRLRWPGPDNAQPALAHVPRGEPAVWWQLGEDGRLQRLARPDEGDTSGNFVDYLHRKGGLPIPLEVAEPLIGLVSLVYGLALVSGVVILLPSLVKDLFYLRLGRNLKRMWLDVHNLLGVASLPFHLVIALSAAVFGLHDIVYLAQDKFIYQDGLRATAARDSIPPPASVDRNHWLPPSAIRERVLAQAPQFQPVGLDYVVQPTGTTALVVGSDERHFQRASRYGLAFVHLGTGQIYDRTYLPGESGHASTAVLNSLFSLHFGSYGGDTVRLLYVALGLSGALLFYTGNLLWIETRTKRARKPQDGPALTRPRHVRIVSALTVGVCLGCAAALPATLALARWLAPYVDDLNTLHQGAYYTLFCGCIGWALWRGTAGAAPGLLWFTAACNALVPLAVLLDPVPDGFLLGALCGLSALFFAWLSRRHRAEPAEGTPSHFHHHRPKP